MKTLWLLDGTSIAYRAFFAFIRAPLRNSKGENTSAVFGFINSLLKLLKEKNPEYMLVCFDAAAPTFRHKQFKEYKATRPKAPPELHTQIPVIKRVVQAFGIQVCEKEGVEADDVIGTAAKLAKKKGFEAIIFADDKDFLQLEENGIKVFSPRTFEFIHSQEKLNIPASLVPDFLALTGDTVDNIPGVRGIGPKNATQLLNEFGGLDSLYINISKIKSEKIRTALLNSKDIAFLSKQLATIKTDVDSGIVPASLKTGALNEDSLFSLLRELEFFSIIKKLKTTERKDVGNRHAVPLHKLDEICGSIKEQVSIVSKPPYFSLSCDKEKVFIFSLSHPSSLIPHPSSLIPLPSSLLSHPSSLISQASLPHPSSLTLLMENEKIRKVVPCCKPLFKEFNLKGPLFDLELAAYLLNPGAKDYSLDKLTVQWIDEALPSKPINWVGRGAEVCDKLYEVLQKELKHKGLYKLYSEVEVPLARVLSAMEQTGVLIDKEYFAEESKKISSRLEQIEEKVYSMVGEKFNLRSPAQLSHILFDKLKLPKSRHKKTHYSTDQMSLLELAQKNAGVQYIEPLLEYRELFKLKSTYLDPLIELANEQGRVHTNWQQTATATGRLSSTNPNLQNIPRQEIRKGFIASPGCVIMSADYSQIELRILASVSGDPMLINAFNEGKDIHKRTASLIFNIPESRIRKEERKIAKTVNFGIIYGMGPYGLSKRLGISVNEAGSFIASYFNTYPGVKSWITGTLEFVRKNGFVQTLLGRKRWFQDINSMNTHIKEFAERMAINAPIQGSAADMIKVAMIKLHNSITPLLQSPPYRSPPYRDPAVAGDPAMAGHSKLIIQVHDELVLEVPEEEIDSVKQMVKETMEQALPLKVPVVIDIGIGKNWDSAH